MDPRRDLWIRILRSRGKSYKEIKKELHVGESTITRALGVGRVRRAVQERAGVCRSVHSSPSLVAGSAYIGGNTTVQDASLSRCERTTPVSPGSPVLILNKEATKIVFDPICGVYRVPINNPNRSSNLIIKTPSFLWFWKFLLAVGFVIFIIWVLGRIKEY